MLPVLLTGVLFERCGASRLAAELTRLMSPLEPTGLMLLRGRKLAATDLIGFIQCCDGRAR